MAKTSSYHVRNGPVAVSILGIKDYLIALMLNQPGRKRLYKKSVTAHFFFFFLSKMCNWDIHNSCGMAS